MRRILVCSMVFTAFVVLPFAVTAQNGNNKNKGKTTQATPQEYAQLTRLSQIVGKIVSTDATKITFSIDHPHAVPSTSGRARRATVQHDQIEFELPLKEKAVVRKMYISMGFDEKGNPKTSASPDDKGKKPAAAPGGGYACDIADLIPGTVVRLQLAPPKKSATAKKDDDAAADLSTHSTVLSVTALSEPKDQMMAGDNGNTKKKKNQ